MLVHVPSPSSLNPKPSPSAKVHSRNNDIIVKHKDIVIAAVQNDASLTSLLVLSDCSGTSGGAEAAKGESLQWQCRA